MNYKYQNDLACVVCESKGTIKKIDCEMNAHIIGDRENLYVCTNCKHHSSLLEAVVNNLEDIPIILDENFEWDDKELF